MPRRRRTRTRNRKRPYRKKRSDNGFYRSYGKGAVVSLPYPNKMRFNTRYVESSVVLNPGAGVADTHIFQLNGLYDPDISGVGHQPIGFDQVMTMYDHYTVIGARAKVFIQNGENSIEQLVCCRIADSSVVSGDIQNAIENGNCRWTNLGIKGSSRDCASLTIGFSAKKFFSRSPLTSSNLQGNVSSNPSEGAYLHIMCQGLNSKDAGSTYVSVVIEYACILTEPKLLTSS